MIFYDIRKSINNKQKGGEMSKIYKSIFIIFMIITIIFSTCIVSLADDDNEKEEQIDISESIEEVSSNLDNKRNK